MGVRIGIVGAGAAGCFCSIELKRRMPEAEVMVFESGRKPLAKVAITGGGRCNLTNSFRDIANLGEAYPRGERLMKRALSRFNQEDTWKWFEAEGVKLVLQEDQCVFPRSQDAMQIVQTLINLMRKNGVKLYCESRVTDIRHRQEDSRFELSIKDKEDQIFDYIIVTTGGSPKISGLAMLNSLELEIIPPVPSLFSFNIPDKNLTSLMGTVVENTKLSLIGTNIKSSGVLLITHWGLSGPAALKLSSHGARHLAENGYSAELSINWVGLSDQLCRERLSQKASKAPQKLVCNERLEAIPARLWTLLLERSSLRPDIRWAEVGHAGLNRLTNTLTNDIYPIRGKSRFKEEFVTCGGIALSNISIKTLESKKYPGLYFAGEVLDLDAITGGFNLQAAWSTAQVIASSFPK